MINYRSNQLFSVLSNASALLERQNRQTLTPQVWRVWLLGGHLWGNSSFSPWGRFFRELWYSRLTDKPRRRVYWSNGPRRTLKIWLYLRIDHLLLEDRLEGFGIRFAFCYFSEEDDLFGLIRSLLTRKLIRSLDLSRQENFASDRILWWWMGTTEEIPRSVSIDLGGSKQGIWPIMMNITVFTL